MSQFYSEGRVVSLLRAQLRAQAHFSVFHHTGKKNPTLNKKRENLFSFITPLPPYEVLFVWTCNQKYLLVASRFKSTSCNTTNSWQSPTKMYIHSSTGTSGVLIWLVSSLRKGMASHCGHPDLNSSKVQEYSPLGLSGPDSYIPKTDFKMVVHFLEFMVGNSIADATKGHQRHRKNMCKPCVK